MILTNTISVLRAMSEYVNASLMCAPEGKNALAKIIPPIYQGEDRKRLPCLVVIRLH